MASAAISIVSADGAVLDQILDATHEIWNEGLTRAAYGRYNTAQLETPWGHAHLTRVALVDRGVVLASAKRYELAAMLDGLAIRVIGIGAVFTQPAHRGHGYGYRLVEHLLERAAGDAVAIGLLFSEIGAEYYQRLGFETIPTTDHVLGVLEPEVRGAPAALVRPGDDRDLPAIAAMGRARAEPFRFHLDRDHDWIHYALSKKRLLAGLGPAGERQVQFFVAEEGGSAVAYVVLTTHGGECVLEECGDRDVSGARVGAILQTLLARQPDDKRPLIRGRLPVGFLPPQLRIVDTRPTPDVMMICPLASRAGTMRPLGVDEVLYWHADLF